MWTYKPRQGRKAATVVCSNICRGHPGIFEFECGTRSAESSTPWSFGFVPNSALRIPHLHELSVIAENYRPQRFRPTWSAGARHADTRQRHRTEAHRPAYLFCGRAHRQTTIARIFAKCLNCTGGPKIDFDEKRIRAALKSPRAAPRRSGLTARA